MGQVNNVMIHNWYLNKMRTFAVLKTFKQLWTKYYWTDLKRNEWNANNSAWVPWVSIQCLDFKTKIYTFYEKSNTLCFF